MPSGVSLNSGENFRMKCICSTALGGRCLWFANQDGDFWTTATVWQRHPARGLSVFKAKGPLSLTVSVCHNSHISRDGTSRGCYYWIVCIFSHKNLIIHTEQYTYSQHRGNTCTVTNSIHTAVDAHTHTHTHTYYNAAFWAGCVGRWHCLTLSHLLSALPALLWDIARCRERESKREIAREGREREH